MTEIERNAQDFADAYTQGDATNIQSLLNGAAYDGYVAGATKQEAKDIDKAKEAFNKTCGWLAVYPWYNGVFEEFVKAMEE